MSGDVPGIVEAWRVHVAHTDWRGNGPTFSAAEVERFLWEWAGRTAASGAGGSA